LPQGGAPLGGAGPDSRSSRAREPATFRSHRQHLANAAIAASRVGS